MESQLFNYFPKILPAEPTISQKYYLESQLFPKSTTWRERYFPEVLHGIVLEV
jgi:hypothetical protein